MQVIDFHTHTFPDSIAQRVIDSLSSNCGTVPYTDGTNNGLIHSMCISGVTTSLLLPVMTRPDQVVSVNDCMIRSLEAFDQQSIVPFGGIHPLFDDCRSEIKRLKRYGIKGIKLHPAFQKKHINDIVFKRIIEAASAEEMITVMHAGIDIGIPEENYASVPEILEVIRDVHPEKLVLAHLGGWQAWNAVKQDLAGAPVWLDTAFSLGTLEPRVGFSLPDQWKKNLDPKEFVSLARSHGTEHILFATDSPWAEQTAYIRFILSCGLSAQEQQRIFYDNGAALLKLNNIRS